MKTTLNIFLLICLFIPLISFSQVKSIDTESLAKMLEGSYSSEEQSRNDPAYSDLRLHIKRIWTSPASERSESKWLYFEESKASDPDKPFRQGIYRITYTHEGRFERAEFTLNDPLRFVGGWKVEDPVPGLTPDSLSIREGCAVILTLMNDGSYEGGSGDNYCASDLNGAKYATSIVKLSQDGLISWDRGFDEFDNQVWGALKGGYVFKRVD